MRESDLGGEETKLSRERLREMKTRSHRTYILRFSKSRQIEVSRGVETSVEISVEQKCVDKCSCRGSVKVQISRRLKEA